jgi:DNA-binding GntR family transcriptional regulator
MMLKRTDKIERPAAKTPHTKKDTRGNAEQAKVYETIYDAIVRGDIPPGTKLTEERLSAILKTSRGHVRQALRLLGRDRVVTIHPNRGAFVAEPSVKEAKEVFAARKYLEPSLAADIIKSFDKRGIAKLRDHIRAEKIAESRPDKRREIVVSQDFHLLLCKAIGNDVVVKILEELLARSALITMIYEKKLPQRCSHESHADLIDLIEQGNAKKFAALMLEHLEEIESELELVQRDYTPVKLEDALARRGGARKK